MPAVVSGLFISEAEAHAARWVQRKLGSAAHERRVLSVAARLFELTYPLLKLTESDAELLRLAALTHDVGRSVSEKNHPAEGAAMIERTTALDVPSAVRRRLAFLARYHRGAVPPAMNEEYLTPADPRRSLRAILALLRTADALDHRHLPASRLAFDLSDRRLSIRCIVPTDFTPGELARARRVYKRRKKYRLLEAFLGCSVQVTVEIEKNG